MVLVRLGFGVIAAAGLTLGTVQPAYASLITFETSGVFGSTGTSTLVARSTTVTFTGVSHTVDVSASDWIGSLGYFTVAASPGPSTGGLAETFTLTLAPQSGSARTFVSTLHGQINFNNTNATVTFGELLMHDADGVQYSILHPAISLALAGAAHVSGSVRAAAGGTDPAAGDVPDQSQLAQVPEPGTLWLAGLAALACGRRLRQSGPSAA